MSNTKDLNSILQQFKSDIDLSQQKIVAKDMPISNLGLEQVGDESYISIKSGTASKLFRTTPNAIKSIAGLVGMDEKLIRSLESTMGKEATNKLLFIIKRALQSNNKTVRIVINFQTKTILDVQEKPIPFLSNENFLQIVESKLNGDTEIMNQTVGPDGTAKIVIKSPNWGFKLAGKKDEEFQMGMVLSNGITSGTYVAPYFFRLVCTNGIVRESKSDQFTLALKGTKEDYIKEFITGIDALNFNNFDPSKFHERVIYMENTRASFAELYKFRKLAEDSVDFQGQDEKTMANLLIEEWFPTTEIKALYARKGIVFEDLTVKHFKNIKTKLTCWDLLNQVTDFASHDYGTEISQSARLRLQGEAGTFMDKKTYDTEFLVPQVF